MMQRLSLVNLLIVSLLLSSCSDTTTPPAGTSKKMDPLMELKQRLLSQWVFVEGGTFKMGDVGYTDEKGYHHGFTGDADTRPVHDVTLTSYSIQAYETTFDDFDFYMTSIGEEIVRPERRHSKFYNGQYPAMSLTWYQARDYCLWLGKQIGYPVDLPTEAQWEYAARSRGKAVAHATNDGDIEYGVNYRDPRVIKHEMPIGSWPPNPLGIYDMTGNVSEWTLDLWHGYRKKPLVDPSFNDEKTKRNTSQRMWRGFGVLGGKGIIQLYRRGTLDPNVDGAGIGIRCVANHPKKIQ